MPIKEDVLYIRKPEDRFRKYEQSFQLSILVYISLPEGNLKQQQFKHEKKKKELGLKSEKTQIRSKMNKKQFCSLELANQKGASSWLNATPLKQYHFDLAESEFRDGIALRYGWEPVKMP